MMVKFSLSKKICLSLYHNTLKFDICFLKKGNNLQAMESNSESAQSEVRRK